jgi:hypothetical protein
MNKPVRKMIFIPFSHGLIVFSIKMRKRRKHTEVTGENSLETPEELKTAAG